MSIVFSAAIYVIAGIAIVVWLAGQGRLSGGPALRVVAVIFWPAYLPICMAPSQHPRDDSLDGLLAQIERLPVSEARRGAYRGAVARLGRAMEQRSAELVRLGSADARLRQLGEAPLVEKERERLREARAKVERDLAGARESVLRLVLRLELIDLEGSSGTLEANLATLEEELGGLLDARATIA